MNLVTHYILQIVAMVSTTIINYLIHFNLISSNNCVYLEPEPIDQILTYEEVALHYPRADRRRPVVLIGPPNIGRHELRQRLMADPAGRFAAAVPRKHSN